MRSFVPVPVVLFSVLSPEHWCLWILFVFLLCFPSKKKLNFVGPKWNLQNVLYSDKSFSARPKKQYQYLSRTFTLSNNDYCECFSISLCSWTFCPILYLVSVCDRQGRCMLPCEPVREVLNKQLDRMEILECLTLVETRQEPGRFSI